MIKRYRKDGDLQHYRIIAVSLVTIVFLIAACGTSGSGTTSPQSVTPTPSFVSSSPVATPLTVAHVKIVTQGTMYAFVPATLTIKVGTQVVWSNDSNAPHTVSSDSGVFNTPNPLGINPGQTYAFTFTKPGTYPYYCNIHTYMTGKIVVMA
jgi:plastocyanin